VTDFNNCNGAYCEEMSMEIDGYADFACQENGAETAPVCTNVSGTIEISGFQDITGGGSINGSHPFYFVPGGLFQGFGPDQPADATTFGIPSNVLARLHPPFGSYPFCGGNHTFVSDPPDCYQRTTTCPGGVRSVLHEQANCANGILDNLVYRDCFLWDQTYVSEGNYLPPCPPNEAWNDSGVDRITLTPLAGCQSQPAWNAPPPGPERPSPINTAGLPSTAAMLAALAE
jgi:hypothetical protein